MDVIYDVSHSVGVLIQFISNSVEAYFWITLYFFRSSERLLTLYVHRVWPYYFTITFTIGFYADMLFVSFIRKLPAYFPD